MYGSRYVWMMIGDYVKRWWELANDTECTRSQLAKAAEGYFTIDSLSTLSEDDMSTANIVSKSRFPNLVTTALDYC